MSIHEDHDLGLTVDVPPGWEVGTTDEVPLVLLAPVEDDFRANITFDVEELVPPTEERFREIVEQAARDLPALLDDFEQVSERATVQQGLPMHLRRSRWRTDGGVPVAQVTALVTDGQHLWQVHATARRSREAEDLPTFRAVLDSIRWWSGADA